MARYIDIRSIEELDKVQRELHEKADTKRDSLISSVSEIRNFYTPSNIVRLGLSSAAESAESGIGLIGRIRELIRKRNSEAQASE